MLVTHVVKTRQEKQRALLNYYEALASFKDFNNLRAIGMCQNNIGHIYMINEEYLKAEEHYKEAVEMAELEENQRENHN